MEDKDLKLYLEEKRQLVDKLLASWLASEVNIPSPLYTAIEYSLMAGGKRIRPILCIATAENYIKPNQALYKAACAIELLHTYSLIHDDLPSMDNDDYRRGKLTCHKMYGEATAILAGDGLQALAFKWLSEIGNFDNCYIDPSTIVKIINIFAQAVGPSGMVGGQMLDLTYQNKPFTSQTLEQIHLKKTAALISTSIEIGALIANIDNIEYKLLKEYGLKLGLLFQIVDDLLDETGTFSSLGKTPLKDRKDKKATYTTLYGLEKTKQIAKEIYNEAVSYLNKLNKTNNILLKLTNYLLHRSN